MPILTYIIETTTRTNNLTSISITVKTVKPSIDGSQLIHHYVFDGNVTDITAKASVKADLEGRKGYGPLTEL